MKTQLFKSAWAIRKIFNTFAEALKMAWKAYKLKLAMKTNNVVFQFKKINGEIREAVGTLNVSYESKGGTTKNYGVINFYDCSVNGWRSFKIENLV